MADIHFCNICDQSILLQDLEEGSALLAGERAICPSCRKVLGAATPGKAVPSSGNGSGAIWAAILIGLLGWVAAALVWFQGQDAIRSLRANVHDDFAQAQAEISSSLVTGRESQVRFEERVVLLEDVLTDFRRHSDSAVASAQTSIQELAQAMASLSSLGEDIVSLQSRSSQNESGLQVAEERLRSHRRAQEALRDQVAVLSKTIQKLQLAATAQDAQDDFPAEVSALLRKLQAKDPLEREAALEKLSKYQDERLLPHIYPLLGDPFEMTRFLAAHTLGEWEARAAVPHLIEALLDDYGFVRQAAMQSLRRITAQNFGYNHDGNAEALQAGYELWKSWWASNGTNFSE
ncbi:MAG: hypothetical protein HOE66_09995 [Planctomycetes bacterium]|jgi:hypothetical protein|nr:hypothetical protein [Planctomycetota bacterium]